MSSIISVATLVRLSLWFFQPIITVTSSASVFRTGVAVDSSEHAPHDFCVSCAGEDATINCPVRALLTLSHDLPDVTGVMIDRSKDIPTFLRPPHAVAIDLDGTLLNSQMQLSDRNRRGLEQCIEHGIPVIIATSRPARIFNRIFPRDLAQKCSFILMNGAIAKGNPPLCGYIKETLPDDILLGLIECALSVDPHVRIAIEIDGFEFGSNWTTDPATLWQRNSATPDMVLSLDEALKRRPCKVALGGTNTVRLAGCLTRRFGNSISVVEARIDAPILSVTSQNATNPRALGRLLAPHSIHLDEVMAFGDDIPDIDMLGACRISVGMGNAFPEVKAICKYLTVSNDEDGVALVLEEVFRRVQ